MSSNKAQVHFQRCEAGPEVLSRADSRAARHLVLERITPLLRHHMVGHLHPISLLTTVLASNLSDKASDVPKLQARLKAICSLLGSATHCVGDAAGWIRPDRSERVPLSECVEECFELLRGSFNFRGYELVNAIGQVDMQVHRDAVRICLVAALLAATDAAIEDLASIVIRAAVTGRHSLVLTVSVEATLEDRLYVPYDDEGDVVSWLDLENVARTHGVLAQSNDSTVSLSFDLGRCPGQDN